MAGVAKDKAKNKTVNTFSSDGSLRQLNTSCVMNIEVQEEESFGIVNVTGR
jgi:hypothetical protein